MATSDPYRLSFTVGGLLSQEAAVAAPLFLESGDWELARTELMERNLLGTRLRTTALRVSREVVQRLSELSRDELRCLAQAPGTDRNHIMWVAVCRRYQLVGQFAQSVLRDKYLLGDLSLAYEDFDRFCISQALWHAQLEQLKDSTRDKLRRNLFLALRQAGFLTETGSIVEPLLSPQIAALLDQRAPSDIRYFPAGGAL
ncbi:MAG: DUF1819 family protein [Micrococcales bacterium]|nr:DUF1819 family protein [Micrococcales bacterium]